MVNVTSNIPGNKSLKNAYNKKHKNNNIITDEGKIQKILNNSNQVHLYDNVSYYTNVLETKDSKNIEKYYKIEDVNDKGNISKLKDITNELMEKVIKKPTDEKIKFVIKKNPNLRYEEWSITREGGNNKKIELLRDLNNNNKIYIKKIYKNKLKNKKDKRQKNFLVIIEQFNGDILKFL